MADRSLREVARNMGMSAATLSRVERGEVMDGKTLASILRWLLVERKV